MWVENGAKAGAVEFETQDDSDAALKALDGEMIHDAVVRCSVAESSERPSGAQDAPRHMAVRRDAAPRRSPPREESRRSRSRSVSRSRSASPRRRSPSPRQD